MRKEQDTSLSVSLNDSANLVFKDRAKLSLKHLKPRLVQQLHQCEKNDCVQEVHMSWAW